MARKPKLGRGPQHGPRKAKETGKEKRRRPWKQCRLEEILDGDDPEDGEEEEDPSHDDEGDEYDKEPEDDSEVREAERGLEDEYSKEPPIREPSTRDDAEIDADEGFHRMPTHAAITFFEEEGEAVSYVVAERRSPLEWRRLDLLARFIKQSGRSLAQLRALSSANSVRQKDFIDFLGGEEEHPAGQISDLLHKTTISVDGAFAQAVRFFRENISRTAAARERARDLLKLGSDDRTVLKALAEEFGAHRNTATGWIRWAKERLDHEISKR